MKNSLGLLFVKGLQTFPLICLNPCLNFDTQLRNPQAPPFGALLPSPLPLTPELSITYFLRIDRLLLPSIPLSMQVNCAAGGQDTVRAKGG